MGDGREQRTGGPPDLVAVVTASGGMMGGAISRALATAGHAIVVNDRVEDRTEAAHRSIDRLGVPCAALTADVGTPAGASDLIALALERWGRVDVLVNVAGGIKGPIRNKVWEISDEQWDVTLAVNLTSAFLTTRAVLPSMIERRQGAIVNIASTSWAGSPEHAHYAAAKAGLVSLTRSVARQCGPHGIRCNVVAPGGTITRAAERPDGAEISDPNAAWLATVPLGRANEPDDVANAVRFLVSDDARNISGQILTVAGGLNPSL